MLITSLVENTSTKGLPVEHGLSLHLRLDNGRQLLFDMGQRLLFAENAQRLGIAIDEVDVAILSHGHYDHGGGLRAFLLRNEVAPVWLQRRAFEPHYSLREEGLKRIGLDTDLLPNVRFRWVDEVAQLDDQLLLFANVQQEAFNPPGNRLLFGPQSTTLDTFVHEQSLLVSEAHHLVLFAGCAHSGIVNILRRAEQLAGRPVTHVFAGMHLVKSGLSPADETAFVRQLARELLQHEGTRYFTMHCTGVAAYEVMREEMGEALSYFACGDQVQI